LAQKHEVIAIIVRDRREDNPQKLGETVLKSPINRYAFDTFFGKKSIENYLDNLKEHDEKLMEHFSTYGVRVVQIFTDEEVIAKLVKLF
jgi:lipopolysaccharide biosynthesis protein